jgi:D-serine deaminase-like pyridoxal phosphate-dependent protein
MTSRELDHNIEAVCTMYGIQTPALNLDVDVLTGGYRKAQSRSSDYNISRR